MKFKKAKKKIWRLCAATALAVSAFAILIYSVKSEPTPYFEQQLQVAKLMEKCIDALRQADFDSEAVIFDPNRTNLIGREFSTITTTLGDLTAKRTATNPDFAALFVKWFHELNLASGNVIAIGSSGSFPSLTIAALSAAETMNLRPIHIISLGASTFGANRPDFTLLDMEKILLEKNILHHKTISASFGGSDDRGGGLIEEGISLLKQIVARNHVPLIEEENFAQNVQKRADLYLSEGEPAIFINIGGARINIGNYETASRLSPGINKIHWRVSRPESMVEFFAAKGIPVIHLLNIKKIALKNYLPVDPIPLPVPGESAIYFEKKISFLYIALICSLVLFAWIFLM